MSMGVERRARSTRVGRPRCRPGCSTSQVRGAWTSSSRVEPANDRAGRCDASTWLTTRCVEDHGGARPRRRVTGSPEPPRRLPDAAPDVRRSASSVVGEARHRVGAQPPRRPWERADDAHPALAQGQLAGDGAWVGAERHPVIAVTSAAATRWRRRCRATAPFERWTGVPRRSETGVAAGASRWATATSPTHHATSGDPELGVVGVCRDASAVGARSSSPAGRAPADAAPWARVTVAVKKHRRKYLILPQKDAILC